MQRLLANALENVADFHRSVDQFGPEIVDPSLIGEMQLGIVELHNFNGGNIATLSSFPHWATPFSEWTGPDIHALLDDLAKVMAAAVAETLRRDAAGVPAGDGRLHTVH